MENPTPFDLNQAIRRWQQNLANSPAFKAGNLEELASHLRASVQRLKAEGLSEEEAFQTATRRLGERDALEREFAKVNDPVVWSHSAFVFWIVTGMNLLWASWYLIAEGCGFYEFLFARMPNLQHPFIAKGLAISGLLDSLSRHHNLEIPWYLSPAFAPAMAIPLVLFLFLCVRLVLGEWKRFGAFVRVFAHPRRTALCLAALGFVPAFLPAFRLRLDSGSVEPIYSLVWFHLGNVLAAIINIVFVCTMIYLARRTVRRHTTDANTSHNRATITSS